MFRFVFNVADDRTGFSYFFTGKSRVLIDTGEGKPEYLTNLMEGMKACGCERISDIIVTHWHIDHLGGVPSLMDRFDHEIRVHKFMPERKEKLFGGEGSTDPYKIWPEDKFVPLKDGQIFRVDEENTLRIMHTPGHANDHVTLFHEEEKAIVRFFYFSSSTFFSCISHGSLRQTMCLVLEPLCFGI